MENKKLTQEELEQIADIQNKYQAVSQELGSIELQKIALETRRQAAEQFLAELQKEEKEVAQAIEKEYGKGNINLKTGEFTPVQEEEVIEE
jgi:hypothetical protein